ncbi:MAG: PIG-L family deacetylase [Candidatus Saelkia tenebricola]|nr:PIG-L family deacetylase [Candidatus Saelkia tenebricola]
MINSIPEHKKIIIFSPHPDDEVIGMGIGIRKIAERGGIFKVAYLTDGERGVSGNGSDLKKKKIRRREAIKACSILGVREKDLEFLDLPFYKTRVPDSEDVEVVYDLLTTFMPDVVFVCIDKDPNSTHKKAAQIIDEALIQYDIKSIIYCYKSVWEDYNPAEVNFCVEFDEPLMELKLLALGEYQSQFKNPDFNTGSQGLLQRVRERDRKLAKGLKLKSLYAEGFLRTESL